jgi:hypothetical protein
VRREQRFGGAEDAFLGRKMRGGHESGGRFDEAMAADKKSNGCLNPTVLARTGQIRRVKVM